MTISSIIEDVTGNESTLTVYDASDSGAVAAVRDHFAVQNVEVVEATTSDGPDDFAVLHDDEEFLAAADLDELRQAVTFEGNLLDADGFEDVSHPDVLKHVSDTTFTTYGKRRMILASREIEEQAWRTGDGELHAGFQQLSLLRDQWELYDRIDDRGVDVHAYGVTDWRPPEADWLTVHDADTPGIRDSWFVTYDAPDGTDCALVAEECEPDVFSGFWTYDEDLVADLVSYLHSEY